MLSATDAIVRGTAVCGPEDDLHVAVQRMRDSDCCALPVVNHMRQVVGILTGRDVCLAAARSDRPLRGTSVAQVMSTDVRSVGRLADIDEVHHVMRRFVVRRVPIVDGDDRLIGVVSVDDLAAHVETAEPVERARLGRMLMETFAVFADQHATR